MNKAGAGDRVSGEVERALVAIGAARLSSSWEWEHWRGGEMVELLGVVGEWGHARHDDRVVPPDDPSVVEMLSE